MAGFLSPAAHTGVASFDPVVIVVGDGHRLRLQDQMSSEATEAFARTLLCGILASISRQLDLGLDGDLDVIRREIVVATDDPDSAM